MRYVALLRRWEKTCEALGAARRRRQPAVERRLDLSVADQKRQIVSMLYKDAFGYRIGYPKLPRSRLAKRKS